ncbi:MAG: hypothetical protein LW875_00325 [Proteobacteria bacterium]|jgi:hypothetical protein|nr:hypothetical protein [Pseudomonadota bacterium]
MKFRSLSLILSLCFVAQGAFARNLLQYSGVINVSDYKGQTFLSLMQTVIKPELDSKATEGFRVAAGKDVVARLKLVDSKISRRVMSAAGSLENLKALADQLRKDHASITFYDLPQAIADAGYGRGRFDLSIYLAMVSSGGVAVALDENNITYNVNYGTGSVANDERTGRSYAESHDRLALDASYKHYLSILEDYVTSEPEDISDFYRWVLLTLLNSDSSGVKKISKPGQAVAADFLAVYIAEQNRHLMSNMTRHNWDEAHLEVTLLGAFHSGQERTHVMFGGELTDKTLEQVDGCEAGTSERSQKEASMVDYWQFSSSSNPEHCKRSGINITRKDFRALGALITERVRETHPNVVKAVEKRLGISHSKNLFADLTEYITNNKTPKKMTRGNLNLVEEYVAFLLAVQETANEVTLSARVQ